MNVLDLYQGNNVRTWRNKFDAISKLKPWEHLSGNLLVNCCVISLKQCSGSGKAAQDFMTGEMYPGGFMEGGKNVWSADGAFLFTHKHLLSCYYVLNTVDKAEEKSDMSLGV